MLDFISSLLGKSVDFSELIANGAIIIDVRTKEEYRYGHIKNSVNIPLDKLQSNLKKLNKNKVIITCCQSGSRSSMAKSILRNNGFQVYNGGGWQKLNRYC
jgi:rhodanese-related sulfurtransferase